MLSVASRCVEWNEEKSMQDIRHVRSLCWFLGIWFGILVICWNEWSWQFNRASVSLHILFTMLMIAHLGIYLIGLCMPMKRRMQWLLLFAQAGLILLLTQLTQLVVMVLFLSPVLFLVATIVLRNVPFILVLLGGYLLLLLVYMNTFGPGSDWYDLWSGGYAPMIGTLGFFFLVVLMLYLQQEQCAHERTKTLLHELDSAHAELAAYAVRVEELTTVTERQRIARELHDTLSQGLTALVMQLDVAHSYFAKDSYLQGQEIVTQTMTQARTILTEMRYVLRDLRNDRLRPDDLADMVQEEVDHFMATTGVLCETKLDALVHMPAKHCTHVLRFVTEGLTNIASHAQAHHVCIRAIVGEQKLEIEISDDGVGFNPASASSPGHYGLVGLHERTRLMEGHLTIKSSPGKGTLLLLSIPRSDEGRYL